MSETAPPVLAASPPPEKPSAAKKMKKPAKVPVAAKKRPAGPPVSELIVQAVSFSKERSGVSLAALKKALAAAVYDVEKNSRMKLGLKSLVSKGTLVQTKGTGASSSFKANKISTPIETKPNTTEVESKRKVIAKKASVAASKKSVKSLITAKRPAVAKKPKVVKPKKVVKSPPETKAVKPKATKTKVTKPKTAKRRKVVPKKK
ncbi:LOW QUALITY PROTEIN: histone H1.1-like [Manis javanica]|uniref:LOW QUALITY PROTEIN: histone H1.1-like n=1 Tax=Manis javanica TaxID=9974 RepID=UPI003C6CDE46